MFCSLNCARRSALRYQGPETCMQVLCSYSMLLNQKAIASPTENHVSRNTAEALLQGPETLQINLVGPFFLVASASNTPQHFLGHHVQACACMHICMCMYVCIYIYIYISVHGYSLFVHLSTYAQICINAYMYAAYQEPSVEVPGS